jgi:hypothetical protein
MDMKSQKDSCHHNTSHASTYDSEGALLSFVKFLLTTILSVLYTSRSSIYGFNGDDIRFKKDLQLSAMPFSSFLLYTMVVVWSCQKSQFAEVVLTVHFYLIGLRYLMRTLLSVFVTEATHTFHSYFVSVYLYLAALL